MCVSVSDRSKHRGSSMRVYVSDWRVGHGHWSGG